MSGESAGFTLFRALVDGSDSHKPRLTRGLSPSLNVRRVVHPTIPSGSLLNTHLAGDTKRQQSQRLGCHFGIGGGIEAT